MFHPLLLGRHARRVSLRVSAFLLLVFVLLPGAFSAPAHASPTLVGRVALSLQYGSVIGDRATGGAPRTVHAAGLASLRNSTAASAGSAVPSLFVMTPGPAARRVSLGAPLLSVTPASAGAGAQVLLSGSAFAPGELVLIRLNGTLLGGVSADTAGNFGGLRVTVPAGLKLGVYDITATGVISGRTAGAGFSVVAPHPIVRASIVVSPITAVPGTRITVAGAGFLSNETVLIRFHNAVVQNLRASGGSFVSGGFIVPVGLAPGRYTVTASGAASGRSTETVLTILAVPPVVVPQVFVNPSTVGPRAHLTVSGRGFGSHETMLVRIDGALVLTAGTDAAGSFSAGFTASAVLGRHTVSVTGARSGRAATTVYAVYRPVTPGIGLIPSTAHRGGLVLVNGNNFLPGEIVLITFRGSLVQAATAGREGRIVRVAFRVPGNTPYGSSEVKILGARSGRSALSHLQVTPSGPPAAHLAAAPTTLHRGGLLLLHGSGFMGKETVLIRYRGRIVQVTTADSHGNFSRVGFRIPSTSPYGISSISVSGARSHRSATVQVHVTPVPGTGITVTPRYAARGSSMTITGHGFAGGETVLFYLHGKLVGATTAGHLGNFTRAMFTIPRTIPTGVTLLRAVGARSGHHTQVTVVIR